MNREREVAEVECTGCGDIADCAHFVCCNAWLCWSCEAIHDEEWGDHEALH